MTHVYFSVSCIYHHTCLLKTNNCFVLWTLKKEIRARRWQCHAFDPNTREAEASRPLSSRWPSYTEKHCFENKHKNLNVFYFQLFNLNILSLYFLWHVLQEKKISKCSLSSNNILITSVHFSTKTSLFWLEMSPYHKCYSHMHRAEYVKPCVQTTITLTTGCVTWSDSSNYPVTVFPSIKLK